MFLDSENEGYAENEETFHFYYNREERLKHAPKEVKDYYSGNFKLNKGFRVLFANRANRFLLLAMVVCIALVFFTNILSSESTGKIGAAKIKLSSFSYGEEVYVSLKVFNSKISESFPIEMQVSYIDVDNQIVEVQKVFENYDGSETFLRTKFFDYDIIKIDVSVTAQRQKQELSVPVQRN